MKVGLDTSELDARVDEAKAKVDELSAHRAEPSVRLDDGDVSARADDIRATLDELDARRARPDVGLTAGDLDARIDEVRAKLDELDGRRVEPRLGLDDADFNAKVDRAEARLDALNAKSARPGLGASGGGGEGGAGGGGEGGGLLGALTMGLGALMPGIGGVVTGLGLLGGVGAMALGPVGKALSEAHQASLNVGLTPQQLAATRFSNTVQQEQAQQQAMLAQQQMAQDEITSASQVASAQEQLGMAHEQAAQDAAQAAEQIQTSQMNLASVERSAAESQIQALHSVQQAQQGVEEANYGLSEAQYNLTQAWEAAREQIRQLNDQLADSKLNVQQAELAVKQAEYQQRLIDQNAYSTQLDRQQAALAVLKAQQQVKDSQDQLTASQYQANLVNKQGVDGNQQVIQAKQALLQAEFGIKNAAFAAADAQRQLTLTELNNATQIKEAHMQVAAAERNAAFAQIRDAEQIRQAQRQLTLAQEQAAYTQLRDAEQVAFAQRNVANTIKEQQLQWASMMSTENAAANQFMKDMSRLSPAGRDFVNQVLGMSGAFKQLEFAAQTATLPGFTDFLRGIQALMPTIQDGVTQMGGAISHAFSAMGQLMQTPEFASMLTGLITNGIRFADIVLPAFSKFALELGIIGGQKGAVDGVANLLAGIARALTGMASVLGDYTPQINSFLTAAGNLIAQIGPGLGQIIGLIAQTLEPITRYLNAHPNGTIITLLGQIVASMLLFKPLVGFVSAPFKALIGAVESIKGLPAKLRGIVESIIATWAKLRGLETVSAGAGAGVSGALGAGAAGAGATAAGTVRAAGRDVPVTALPSGLLVPSASMPVLGESSVVPTAEASAVGLAGPLGIAAAAAGLVVAIGYYANQVQRASDRAHGVIEHSSGELTAASSIGNQHVSDAFKQLENGIANSSQSTATEVKVSGGGVMTRIGEYREDWHKHNNALADVIQLGKTQFGQEVALYVTSMGGNVQQLGASLRAQGKTLNQAYDDSMAAAFQDLGGKTKASWAQAEQVMATSLDKYYQSMRQTTTRDYDSLQQITAQLIQDGYNHRSDLEKRDSERLKQLTEQYMTDKNNGLIDTSKSNISRLSQDMEKFFLDMKDHNSVAIAADIKQLGKDTEGDIDNMYDKVDKHQSDRMDQEIAKSQADITRIMTQMNNDTLSALPGGHATGGLITGPGTGTSDSILARLSDGEFVINAKSTAMYRPLLEAINNRFATGGYVDPAAPRAIGDQKTFVEMLGLASAMQRSQAQQSASTNNAGGFSGTAVGVIQQYAQSQLAKFGWGSNQMGPLIKLWNQESSWNPYAVNPSSGAYGIPQSLGHGHPYNLGDYKAQIDWGLHYIASSYGSPAAAWNHEMAYNWYDQGGWLMPGGMPINGLRKPEAVLTPDQSEALIANAEYIRAQRTAGSEPGASKQVNIYFTGTQYPNTEQMAALKREMALALSGA